MLRSTLEGNLDLNGVEGIIVAFNTSYDTAMKCPVDEARIIRSDLNVRIILPTVKEAVNHVVLARILRSKVYNVCSKVYNV